MRIDKRGLFVAIGILLTILSVFACVFLLTGVSAGAGYWLETEPNDTRETAQFLTLSSGVSARGNTADHDWFAVNVPMDSSSVVLHIRKLADDTTTTWIELHKPDGTVTGPFEDNGGSVLSINGVSPGTYYVHARVLSCEPAPTYTPPAQSLETLGDAEYQLEFTLEPRSCQEEVEPNDLATEAQEVLLPSCVDGTGNTDNDDWYMFENATGTSGPQYRAVDVSVEGVPGTTLTTIAVYKVGGSSPDASDQGYGGATVSIPKLAAGSYYVYVSFEGSATYTPPAVQSQGDDFEYSLHVETPLTPPADSTSKIFLPIVESN